MAGNRFGRRRISTSLTVHRGVTIKHVNIALKEIGYMLKFTGYEQEFDFPTYAAYPIGDTTPYPLKNNKWIVYAVGDFTPYEWCKQIYGRLKDTNPTWLSNVYRRRQRARIRLGIIGKAAAKRKKKAKGDAKKKRVMRRKKKHVANTRAPMGLQ